VGGASTQGSALTARPTCISRCSNIVAWLVACVTEPLAAKDHPKPAHASAINASNCFTRPSVLSTRPGGVGEQDST
jgi:hypothetical protein